MLASARPAAAAVGATSDARVSRRPSVYLLAWKRMLRDPFAVMALAVLAVVVVAALTGPLLAPHDPVDQTLSARLRPPVWQERGSVNYLFGTDQLGRDIVSRMIYGAQVSATVGVAVVLLGGLFGTAIGMAAGFFGGRFDTIVVAVIDVVLSFPSLLLALTIVAVLGPNLTTVILALSVRGWVIFARMARGQALALTQFQFVEAARSIGVPSRGILSRHLLPNLVPSIITVAVLDLARVILAESALSFLGLGVQPPGMSWGLMLAEGRNYMLTANWLVTLPGLAIALTVLSVNILATHVRRVLDPFQRGRIETETR
jgi:ABC-type dipeptide/oligopeptide/nickel transport system permease subunit